MDPEVGEPISACLLGLQTELTLDKPKVPVVSSRWRRLVAAAVAVVMALLLWPGMARADGAQLFELHCAGCHVNGGNIIRRGKTLKLAALERENRASEAAIAAIAAAGVGQMSGYGAVLGEEGTAEVAAWVWQQALAGWPKA
jgi:cytochrome c6